MDYVLKIFNYRFHVKEFLVLFFCYLLMEPIFSWLFVPVSVIVIAYEKILSILIFGFMLFKFNDLTYTERIYVVVFNLLMVRLVLESLYQFDSVFQQFTMFTVLYPVIYALFIKYVCRSLKLDLLEFIAQFHMLTYIVFMAFYGRGFSFSLDSVEMIDYGPFSGDSRIVHASSVFMMIIPFLCYLNKYITTRRIKFIAPVIFCLVVILVHQHRSVWSSTLFALLIYVAVSVRVNKKILPNFINVSLSASLMVLLAYFFVSNLYPGFIDFLAERFGEIFNPAKEGSTGNFRIEQREVYLKMFLERPIFGWTFEGFELSNPLVDWWPEKTGQHFHEGYVEMLFYHGIVGFLYKFSLPFFLLFKIFSKKLSQEAIILSAYCISGLLFSFNYVLPMIFWAHLGLCLYYIERKNEEDTKEIKPKERPGIVKRFSFDQPRNLN